MLMIIEKMAISVRVVTARERDCDQDNGDLDEGGDTGVEGEGKLGVVIR
jgi:hypothetical protein